MHACVWLGARGGAGGVQGGRGAGRAADPPKRSAGVSSLWVHTPGAIQLHCSPGACMALSHPQPLAPCCALLCTQSKNRMLHQEVTEDDIAEVRAVPRCGQGGPWGVGVLVGSSLDCLWLVGWGGVGLLPQVHGSWEHEGALFSSCSPGRPLLPRSPACGPNTLWAGGGQVDGHPGVTPDGQRARETAAPG